MFTPSKRRLAAGLIGAGSLLAIAACSSGPPAASTSRAEPVAALATPSSSPSPTPVATPEASPTPDDPPGVPLGPFDTAAQVKELFVALVENYCGPAYGPDNPAPVNPRKATVRRGPTKNEWLVKDKDGDTIVVNTASDRVYSTDGPGGMLPAQYTFGCDGVVFPGTWD